MTPHTPDVLLVEGFLPEAAALIDALQAEVVWDTRMAARKTASLGVPYDYAQMRYAPAPMHPRIEPVLQQLEARLGHRYNNCLLNLYACGDNTMGFHADDMRGLAPGAGVAIVSLGATRTFVFQRVGDKRRTVAMPLAAGSLLWLPPAVHDTWKHGLLAEPEAGARISLTFRAVLAARSDGGDCSSS